MNWRTPIRYAQQCESIGCRTPEASTRYPYVGVLRESLAHHWWKNEKRKRRFPSKEPAVSKFTTAKWTAA